MFCEGFRVSRFGVKSLVEVLGETLRLDPEVLKGLYAKYLHIGYIWAAQAHPVWGRRLDATFTPLPYCRDLFNVNRALGYRVHATAASGL